MWAKRLVQWDYAGTYFLCTYICWYVAIQHLFFVLYCVQLVSLYCHVLLRRALFLKSTGYSVSQIKKRRTSTIILIKYFLIYHPTNWPNAKRLIQIQLPMKDPFSTPNNRACDTTHNCTIIAFQQDNQFKDLLEHTGTIFISSSCVYY